MINVNISVTMSEASLASSAVILKAQPRALGGSALPCHPYVILIVASTGAYADPTVSKGQLALIWPT